MEIETHKQTFQKTANGWGQFLMAVAGLILFIYVIGPMGLQAPMIKPVADFIEENSINANGYYYTDVAEFSDAEMYMKNAMGYAPGKNNKKLKK